MKHRVLQLFCLLLAGCATSFCQQTDRVLRSPDQVGTVQLTQHLPRWASPSRDLGAASPELPLDYLRLTLARSPGREAEFQQLLLDQQNPASPRYHVWLTPAQIGAQFGPSAQDVAAVEAWLRNQGLQADHVANSRMFVVFHGKSGDVERAFHTRMHIFQTQAGIRLSASTAPSIPVALAAVIQSVQGLSEHHPSPASHAKPSYSPCYDGDCYHYVAPGDFATIYDINPVYAAKINGAGQTVAIIGRAQVYSPDITDYQANTGLPQVAPTLVVPPSGVTPPTPNDSTSEAGNDDQLEATLDVQRVSGTAPGATVLLVASLSTATQDGTDIAKDYVIDDYSTLHAAIMTNSFGECEADVAASFVQADNTLFQQAAAEGISALGISGDSGAAGCDPYNSTPPATQVESPNYLCSSGYVTCLGGTEFNDTADPATYWSSTSSSTLESALSYIPEGAWNEPETDGNFYDSGTGGGVSQVIATPYWQGGTGVPGTAGRYTPDISFTSAGHDAYYGCYAAGGGDCGAGYFEYFYGTSAAAPSMAGVVALLNQKEGKTQGNLNPVLYSLAALTTNVYHDATVASSGVSDCSTATPSICDNSTPTSSSLTGGLAGYTLTPGFDLATGWGSVDVANLLQEWAADGPVATTTTFAISPSTTVTAGSSVTLTTKVSSAGATPTGRVSYFAGSTKFATVPLTNGATSFSVSTTGLPLGTYPIQARYSGSATRVPSNSAITTATLKAASSTTTLAIAPASVTPPAQVSATATVTSPDGTPTGTVTFYYEAPGPVSLGTVTLSGGKATLNESTAGVPAGTYEVQAVYSGSSTIGTSSSAKINAVIK